MDRPHLDDRLAAARALLQARRLLRVVAGIERPDQATPAAQREAVERGEGGALVPRLCGARRPGALASFDRLGQAGAQTDAGGGRVFATALGGAPGRANAAPVLGSRVGAIRQGRIERCLPFDTQGRALRLGSSPRIFTWPPRFR